MKKAIPIAAILTTLCVALFFINQTTNTQTTSPTKLPKPLQQLTTTANQPSAQSPSTPQAASMVSNKTPNAPQNNTSSPPPLPKLVQGKTLLDEKESILNGKIHREYLYETNSKYPMVLVKDTFNQTNSGHEQFVNREVMVGNQMMAQFPSGISESQVQQWANKYGYFIVDKLLKNNVYLIQSPDTGVEVRNRIKNDFTNSFPPNGSASIEPHYILFSSEIPNDPSFQKLWGMHNTGQKIIISSSGGSTLSYTPSAGADIDAPEAWDISTGSSDVLVGVIDTGIDRTHPDLAANMWTNPNEIPDDDIDNDNNGYVDDVHGWDFFSNDNDPSDEAGHGTHCAGTIGAVGNNDEGVIGVSRKISMVSLRFIGPEGGYTMDAIKAVNYGTTIGVDMTSNSWGGGGYSNLLYQAIQDAGDQDILFIASAGNNFSDNDITPHYPGGYDLDCIIAVANTDGKDELYYSSFLGSGSNWGATTVDLGAPGAYILSTVLDGDYGFKSGTSMAAPHVSGTVALLKSMAYDATREELKQVILDSVDTFDSLTGKCVTGGRLNAHKALRAIRPPLSLSITEEEVTEDEGMLTNSGFIQLEQPATQDLIIELFSSDTTELLVPSTVTISEGQTSTSFDVEILEDSLLDGTKEIRVSAYSPNALLYGDTIFVHDNETATLAMDIPETITEDDGAVTITLSVNTPVDDDVVVSLTSSDPSALEIISENIIIPAGTDTTTFDIQAVEDDLVHQDRSVTITAHVENWTGVSDTTIVHDSDNKLTFYFLDSINFGTRDKIIWEGEGRLTRNLLIACGGATVSDLQINLSSSDTSELSLPSSVTIPTGTGFTFIPLTVIDDHLLDGDQICEISASSPSFEPTTATFTVIDSGEQELHIEAEDYAVMSGIQTASTSDINGGFKVNSIDEGDYLEYDIHLPQTGVYGLTFRVKPGADGVGLEIKNGRTILSSIDEPGDTQAQTWQNMAYASAILPEGPVTLTILATKGNWELNWIDFQLTGLEPKPRPPLVDAGEDQTVKYEDIAILDGSTDDGILWNSDYRYYWNKQSGPGDVTFSDRNALDTTATFSLPGTYVLKLSGIEGLYVRLTDEVTITVLPEFSYIDNGDGTITITKYNGIGTNIVIPNTIDDMQVTQIASKAFENSTSLTSVVIPSGVVSIGEYAFNNCHNLVNITIPDSINFIGNSAFKSCESLLEVTIPEGVGVTGLDSTFYGCFSLTNVTLPPSLTRIGDYTFYQCTSLQNITIPNSVMSIGRNAFNHCSSLTSIEIPWGISKIEYRTFANCTSLSEVIIPESVATIGFESFLNCTSLTSMTFSKNLRTIEARAFNFCSSLTAVYFRGNAPVLGSFALANLNPNNVIYYLLGTTGWQSTFGGWPTAAWQIADAEFLSQLVPPSIRPGTTFEGHVVYKNRGSTTWSATDNYGIAAESPMDNTIWGINHHLLDSSASVTPGQTHTISQTFTAPSKPGPYDFQRRMTQTEGGESFSRFGDYSDLRTIDVTHSAPVTLEAEETNFTNGRISSNGTFVDGREGFNITWDYDAGRGGIADLTFHINSPSGSRSMSVWVNNKLEGIITHASKDWIKYTLADIALKPDLNSIEIRDTEGTNEFNVDYLLLTPVSESSTLLEAEEATFVKGKLNGDGKSLDGQNGFHVTWNYYAIGWETTDLTLRVKSPTGSRSMSVWINNELNGVITHATNQWTDYTLVDVRLKPGFNTIELKDTEGTNEFDVDYLLATPSITLEAEKASFVNGSISNDGRFVDGEGGFHMTWDYVATNPGVADLSFRVRCPSGSRSMSVWVAGNLEGIITHSSRTWTTYTLSQVILQEGINTIELRDTENTKEFDIDSLVVNPTEEEPSMVGLTIQATDFDTESDPTDDTRVMKLPTHVGNLLNDTWIAFHDIEFGATGASSFSISGATASEGGKVRIRLGSPNGPVIGRVRIYPTGGWSTFETFTTDLDTIPTGTQDLYLQFINLNVAPHTLYLYQIESFQFNE